MTSLTPYLNLAGRCEAALEFYARVLGGRVRVLQRLGDLNPDTPAALARHVIHGEVEAGGIVLLASDGQPGCPAPAAGGPVSITLRLDRLEAQDRVWAGLAEGATINHALHEAFWGDRFGALTDRFGVHWMLTCPLAPPPARRAGHPVEIIAPPGGTSFGMRRFVEAPPHLVFEAWTRPELLKRWWGPSQLECVQYDVDLRVGGGYRAVQRAPDGQAFRFRGEYRAIEPPHRLVATFVFEPMAEHEALETLTLSPVEGGTLITTRTEHRTTEARDGHLYSCDMAEAMADVYGRLDALLAELQAR
jgi:PhnB protein